MEGFFPLSAGAFRQRPAGRRRREWGIEMKILVCSPVIPYPPTAGLKLRVLNLARELAAEHEVHLFCLGTEPPAPEQVRAINDAGMELTVAVKPAMGLIAKTANYARRLMEMVPPEFILSWEGIIFQTLIKLHEQEEFDIVIAEHLFMARYVTVLDCPRVMVLHNIESDLARDLSRTFPAPKRQYKQLTARWAGNYERRMLARMQGAVTVTSEDMRRLGELAPGLAATVVENGVDCSAYSDIAAEPVRPGPGLLYIGLMSYESNIDAVTWFVAAVFPLIRDRFPDASFTVAGAEPVAAVDALAAEEGVKVTGFVEDIKELYRENEILVVPLRHGGGSRLKILEAFAAGKPVVATTKGAEGLAVEDGRHLLIADSPEAMAGAIVRLCSEPETYATIREAAVSLIKERYDWSILAEKLEAFLLRVTGRP
jgi:glycosyltransferase involved in cell wall biosynthesis